jgi:hypothetical protein
MELIVAETSCWDLATVLEIFCLENIMMIISYHSICYLFYAKHTHCMGTLNFPLYSSAVNADNYFIYLAPNEGGSSGGQVGGDQSINSIIIAAIV